ncbi:hypothetical protein Tco_0531489, partial [Tanacetum coccineum]
MGNKCQKLDQPLAMTTTNIFEVNHEDAYDSDVDEGPNAAAAFMANLSSTSATIVKSMRYINDNQIFDKWSYQLSQEMTQEENLDSMLRTKIDDNTDPVYRIFLTQSPNVPTEKELSGDQVYWLSANEIALMPFFHQFEGQKGRTVADLLQKRLTRPTAYKFKTDRRYHSCSGYNMKGAIHTVIIDPHESKVASSGWPFVSTVPGLVTYLVA